MNPYENLANAIIERAAKDYRENASPSVRKSIEDFFRSEWFRALTKIDGEWLIEKLRKEQAHGC